MKLYALLLIVTLSSVVLGLHNDSSRLNVKRSIRHHHNHDNNIVKPTRKISAEHFHYKHHGKSGMKNSELYNDKYVNSVMKKSYRKQVENEGIYDQQKINNDVTEDVTGLNNAEKVEILPEMNKNYYKYSFEDNSDKQNDKDNLKIKTLVDENVKFFNEESDSQSVKPSLEVSEEQNTKDSLIYTQMNINNNIKPIVEISREQIFKKENHAMDISEQKNINNNMEINVEISSQQNFKNGKQDIGISDLKNENNIRKPMEEISEEKNDNSQNMQPIIEISGQQNFKVQGKFDQENENPVVEISGEYKSNIQPIVEISAQMNENMNLKPTLRRLQRILSHAGEISQALHDLKDVLRTIKTTKQWQYPVYLDTQNKTIEYNKSI